MPPPPSPTAATAGRRSPFPVLLIYVAFALFILLLLTSYSPRSQPRGGGRSLHRRLKLHPRNPSPGGSGDQRQQNQQNQQHHAASFDPEIAELERRLEDKEWEREHYRILHGEGGGGADEHMKEWEEFLREDDDFINDDDRFNLADRIRALFPKIDLAPQDGFVSLDELARWNLEQSRADQLHRSAREMELYNKNGDGMVSYGDFRAQHDESHGEVNSLGFPWWKEEHFNASDADGDGLLNKAEFNDFLNPSDSENPKIISLLCKQEIRQRDKDGDGKLNFEEYFHGLHDHIHGYDDENAYISLIGNTTVAKERFAKLDKDNDGFVSDHELEPVLDKLHLSERYYARQQAIHAISEADKDHDGRLTLEEMIENPYAFYGSVFLSDDEDDFHDEFR
ncbi:calumenin-like [Oryza brachyantha]|uniref:EF-hand domain-containing protein n=1 Tax=Oryza brachyantha TaxID=4533 RepID=J3L190_ORYBR|nr:calumenin-like [Oryza brachyantha]